MDTKQIQVNTFIDGLNTDLHPLTTPSNVLTDCINGTVITYNGNEYILQNDMGNFKLEKAKLPTDYIPVGIKEYGGIIYIVSYNPIDKLCQIGSYPSPQTLFNNKQNGSVTEYHAIDINTGLNDNILSDILNNDESRKHNEYRYTELSKKENITIIRNDDSKDLYLNPGDKYWLQEELDLNETEEQVYRFQIKRYYSLSEDKKLYDISDKIQPVSIPFQDGESMKNVNWACPGWISAKPELYTIDAFNLYIIDVNYSRISSDISKSNITFSLQSQAQIYNSSNQIQKVYGNYLECIVEYKNGTITKVDSYNISDKDSPLSDYGSISILDLKTEKISIPLAISEESAAKTITIRALPYISDGNYGYALDQFLTEYIINIDDIITKDDITIFDTYKYIINDQNISINFDINLPLSNINPNINNILKIYPITNEDGKFVKGTDIVKSKESLNLFGQNIINLDFDNKFRKNDLYILSIEIGEESNSIEYNQLLITSELMNPFYKTYNKFQLIPADEWMKNLTKYLGYKSTEVSTSDAQPPIDNSGYFFENSINNIFNSDLTLNNDYTTLLNGKGTSDISTVENNPERKYSGYLKKQTITRDIWINSLEYDVTKEENYYDNVDINGELWNNIEFTRNITNRKITYNIIGENNIEISHDYDSDSLINIDNIAADGYTIGWEGKIPIKSGQRQYLIENIPWYFYSNGLVDSDDDSSVKYIPKEPSDSQTNLKGWKHLKQYSIWKTSVTNLNTGAATMISLSKAFSKWKYSLSVNNTTSRAFAPNQGFSNTRALFKEQVFNDGSNSIIPTFAFTNDDFKGNNVWSYESGEVPNDKEWQILAKQLELHLKNNGYRLLFVPMFLCTHGFPQPLISDHGIGWSPSGSQSIAHDNYWATSAIGILYYSENIRSYGLAIMDIMNGDLTSMGKGLVEGSTLSDTESTYFTQNAWDWFNNNYVASILLGLGLHLFSLRNIKTTNMFILNVGDLQQTSISISNAYISFTRTETINTIKYKNIELSQENFNNIHFTGSNKNFDNINSLSNIPIVNQETANIPNITWFDTNDLIDKVDSQILSTFITTNSDQLTQFTNASSEAIFCDLKSTFPHKRLYRLAQEFTRILKVKDADNYNNRSYNIVVYNGDFTFDDISGSLAPVSRGDGVDGRGYAIMPTVQIQDPQARISVISDNAELDIWKDIEALMQVTPEFKESYPLDINIS